MSVAFAGSTLPIKVLFYNIKNWDIDEIIISHSSLLKSFYIIKKNFPDIKLSILPSNNFAQIIFITYNLLKCKILNRRIYFFHECCCLLFDLLVNIFNNNCEFHPQVTMNSFVEVSPFKFSKSYMLISTLNNIKNFKFYKYTAGNNEGEKYIWSCINYNTNIKRYKINQINFNNKKNIKSKIIENKVLFIVGTEPVDNQSLILLYNKLIKIFMKKKIKVYIKDHPNEDVRLNKKNLLLGEEIPPHIPVELLDDNYKLIVGCASTALISFEDRAYSILDISKISDKEKKLRKKHLFSMPNGKKINFFKSEINDALIESILCE